MIVIIYKINLGHSYGIPYDATVRFYKTCCSSVLYVTANENYLFDHDENAAIDADSMISTFVADRSHSDHALGITGT